MFWKITGSCCVFDYKYSHSYLIIVIPYSATWESVIQICICFESYNFFIDLYSFWNNASHYCREYKINFWKISLWIVIFSKPDSHYLISYLCAIIALLTKFLLLKHKRRLLDSLFHWERRNTLDLQKEGINWWNNWFYFDNCFSTLNIRIYSNVNLISNFWKFSGKCMFDCKYDIMSNDGSSAVIALMF